MMSTQSNTTFSTSPNANTSKVSTNEFLLPSLPSTDLTKAIFDAAAGTKGMIKSALVPKLLAQLGLSETAVSIADTILKQYDPTGTSPVAFDQFNRVVSAATAAAVAAETASSVNSTSTKSVTNEDISSPSATHRSITSTSDAVSPAARAPSTASVDLLLSVPPPPEFQLPTTTTKKSSSMSPLQQSPSSQESKQSLGISPSSSSSVSSSPTKKLYGVDGPDPRILEYVRVLEEYRTKCEMEGNYEEAERSLLQINSVCQQEENRCVQLLHNRHVKEIEEAMTAHTLQLSEFGTKWETYLIDFDVRSIAHLEAMKLRHAEKLKEFIDNANAELLNKTMKFSRELLELRKKEQGLVKARQYAEATRIKVIADELERKERNQLDTARHTTMNARESKLRIQQENELAALTRRIDARRAEHVTTRDMDAKRLMQRNKNTIAAAEARHAADEARFAAFIRSTLRPSRFNKSNHTVSTLSTSNTIDIPPPRETTSTRISPKSKISRSSPLSSRISSITDVNIHKMVASRLGINK